MSQPSVVVFGFAELESRHDSGVVRGPQSGDCTVLLAIADHLDTLAFYVAAQQHEVDPCGQCGICVAEIRRLATCELSAFAVLFCCRVVETGANQQRIGWSTGCCIEVANEGDRQLGVHWSGYELRGLQNPDGLGECLEVCVGEAESRIVDADVHSGPSPRED